MGFYFFIFKIFFFFSLGNCLHAKISDLKIGLFYEHKIHSLVFSPEKSSYQMIADGNDLLRVEEGELVYFSVVDGKIWVQTKENGFSGVYSNIEMRAESCEGVFNLRPVFPALDTRLYEGEMILGIEFGGLQIINHVNVVNYLAGVVEAESGINSSLEFYKAQAVICRTYLYRHLKKHAEEGFNLCDAVYCQVYMGKSTGNEKIVEAVEETRGEVIVDNEFELIDAAFHSNCGGETLGSKDVWLREKEVLRSVTDPYCSGGKSYNWQRSIPLVEWKEYLISQGFRDEIADKGADAFSVRHDRRAVYYRVGDDYLPYRKIREDRGLRSAFFSVEPTPDKSKLILKGRGHGHGVGLCQEGAMEMAARGYTYNAIIDFYFSDVLLGDVSKLPEKITNSFF